MNTSSSSPRSATAPEGRFLRVNSRSTSPAGGTWVLPPPSAAPAAGGWGKPVPRRVRSVGPGSSPAGGAREEMVLQVRFLVSAVIPSGGGALWSSSASRPTSPSSRIRGSVEFVSPRPGSGQRRTWMLKIWRLMCWFFAATAASSGVGSPEPTIDDFPSACGGSWRSKLEEFRSGAPSTASASSPSPGSSGISCNFAFVLDLSVRARN